ncbi:AtzG-like protein [Sphingomonas sp.]|uniref:AtzG-like protein n=1 Tax=Sphingomonas sp. TaxID=28214 RepID=UPI001B18E61F|nr:AtzG-like protein [Sphingomonas sp.]MBO9713216.1 DUF4089 domain-containing protein [Sphingomonas sp.]
MSADRDALEAMLALAAIGLPEECVPGVKANLELLASHWRNVEAFELPADEAE